MTKHYEYHLTYINRPENGIKRKAHGAVRAAIKSGALVRQPCEVCGSAPAHGHHDDYTRPLEVRWLCQTHHAEAHRGSPHNPRPHKTHCKHGHPMIGANIYQGKDGRRCRECYRIRDARRSKRANQLTDLALSLPIAFLGVFLIATYLV